MTDWQSRIEKRREINRRFKDNLFADVNRSLAHSGQRLERFSWLKILLWALRRRGALAVLLFRLDQRAYTKGCRFRAFIFSYLNQVLCGAEIGHDVSIGGGFEITHGGAIVIGGGIIVGENFSIRQGVTIGGAFFGKKNSEGRKFPIIGNNVFVGAGACIAGPVRIGDDVVIGANTVVTKDVPSNTTVAGIPGAVIKANGKKVPLNEQSGVLGNYLKEVDERLKKIESRLEQLERQEN
jgi:serine O-acetyltransferase